MSSRSEAGLSAVASNSGTAVAVFGGLAACSLAVHSHEILVCFPSTPIRTLRDYIGAVQSGQYQAFKYYAETGQWLGGKELPKPSFMQVSKLRFLLKAKGVATGAALLLLVVKSSLSYQDGVSKFEAAVAKGNVHFPSLADTAGPHYLRSASGGSKSPFLVLRLGSAAQVADMLNLGAPLRPVPVLSNFQPVGGSVNQLDVAVRRASSGLSSGCFLSVDAAPDALKKGAAQTGVIIQSGGLTTGGAAVVTADEAVALASRVRSEAGRSSVIVVHVACDSSSSTSSASSSPGRRQLATADGGVLTVDGKAAMLCGVLSWVHASVSRSGAKGSSSSLVVATSAKAAGSSSGKQPPKSPSTLTSPSTAATEEPVHSEDLWFVVESVGGAVRALLVTAQGAATAVSDAVTVGTTNVVASVSHAAASVVGLLPTLQLPRLALPSLTSLFEKLPATSSSSSPVPKDGAPVVYIDFGDDCDDVHDAARRGAGISLLPWWAAQGATPRLVGGDSSSVEAALLRGLGDSGLLLHSCPSPAQLPSFPSDGPGAVPAVVLVRRSAAQGGDVAALQLAKKYALLGVRALALTDALSFDDFASASASAPQGDGGALVACGDVKRAHSFCLSRVAQGVWHHCSAQVAAGLQEESIAASLRKEFAARLGREA